MTLLDEMINKGGERPRLSIAIVTPYDINSVGGVNDNVFTTRQELERRGHKVKVVGPFRGKINDEGVVCSGKPLFKLPTNGSVIRINLWSPYWWGLVRSLDGKFDAVCLHEPSFPSFPQYLASKLDPQKTVNFAVFHRSGKSLTSAILNVWASLTRTKSSFGNIHRRFAVSNASRSFIESYVPGDYEILPNPVDTSLYSPGKRTWLFPNDRTNVFFTGRHGRKEERKGFKYLAKALVELPEEYRNRVRLLIGGPGKIDRESRMYLSRLSGDSYVVLGVIPSEELPTYYASADIVVAPSTGSESFGLVPAQAMASGTATIVSNIEGYTNVVTGNPELTHTECQKKFKRYNNGLLRADGAVLTSPGNSWGIAEAIKLLVDDKALRMELGYKGRCTIEENYDVRKVVDGLDDFLYESLAMLPDSSNPARRLVYSQLAEVL